MSNQEFEVLRNGLDICLKKQELKFKILRKIGEKEYEKEIFFMYESDPFNLLDKIIKKERLTKKGYCKLLIDNYEFDFKNDEVQEIWKERYNSNEEEYFLKDFF